MEKEKKKGSATRLKKDHMVMMHGGKKRVIVWRHMHMSLWTQTKNMKKFIIIVQSAKGPNRYFLLMWHELIIICYNVFQKDQYK